VVVLGNVYAAYVHAMFSGKQACSIGRGVYGISPKHEGKVASILSECVRGGRWSVFVRRSEEEWEREWMADPLLRAHKRRRKADKRMGAAVLCLQRFSYAPHFQQQGGHADLQRSGFPNRDS
jgi:hypothetical protein